MLIVLAVLSIDLFKNSVAVRNILSFQNNGHYSNRTAEGFDRNIADMSLIIPKKS